MKLYNYFVRNPLLPEYCFGLRANESIVATTLSPMNITDLKIISGLANNTELSVLIQETPALLPDHDAVGFINQPNTALMCTILCLGTFLGAYYLRIFRNSHYLGRSARRAFGDFGVPISIIIFVLIDYLAEVKTEKLLVPEGLSPSIPDRSWFVSPGGKEKPVPLWVALACCVPAFLAYILVFMETQISE